jgi:hypothetical protein
VYLTLQLRRDGFFGCIAGYVGETMLKQGILALLALTTITSAAMAECRYVAVRFHFSQNESTSTSGTSSKGSACVTRFWAGGVTHYSSGAIASPPGHGTLTQTGMVSFRYKPTAGFKGLDRYSLKVCGADAAGSGCATITYNLTVE